jgi:hypothetical protein
VWKFDYPHGQSAMISAEYLAGFVDGEGCIGIGSTNTSLVLTLAISQVNLTVLQEIQKDYGGHLTPCKVKGNRRPAWILRWSSKAALSVIEKILPYLIVKKPQAEIAVKEWKLLIPAVGGGQKGLFGGKPLSLENKAKRLEIKQKISSLNYHK